MAVRNKRPPQPGHSVIVHAKVVAGDCAPRKTAEDDLLGVAAVLFTNPRHSLEAVVERRLGRPVFRVAPPSECNVFPGGVEVRQTNPDEIPPSGDAVAHVAALRPTGADVAVCPAVIVAGVLDDDRIAFSRLPIDRQIGDMIDLGFLVAGQGLPDPAAGGRLAGLELGHGQVRLHRADVGRVRLGQGQCHGQAEQEKHGFEGSKDHGRSRAWQSVPACRAREKPVFCRKIPVAIEFRCDRFPRPLFGGGLQKLYFLETCHSIPV